MNPRWSINCNVTNYVNWQMHTTPTLCLLSLKQYLTFREYSHSYTHTSTSCLKHTFSFFRFDSKSHLERQTTAMTLISLLPPCFVGLKWQKTAVFQRMCVTVQIFNLSDLWLSERPDERAAFRNGKDNDCSVLFQVGKQRRVQWRVQIQKKNQKNTGFEKKPVREIFSHKLALARAASFAGR